MNVTINSQELAAELRLLNKVVPTKPTLAILSHALIQAEEQGIVLHATDLEMALTSPCPGRVDMPGHAAVPVAKLLAMVEQFADADVLLTSDGKQVGVSCESFRGRLQAMPTEDFPTKPTVEGTTVSIEASALRGLIAKTRHALNASGAKHMLKGALLTFVGDAVAMVTTDGQRLSLATTPRSGVDLDIIIPAKTLDVLAGSAEGGMEVTVGARHLFFALKGRLLTSRMLEGKFPAYDRIIPRDNTITIQAERTTLAAALRRVVLTAEETQAVYLNLIPGWMRMSSASVGIGSASEDVAIGYEGPELKVCVNGAYLLDFLNAASGASVTLALKDERGSLLMTDGDHLGIVALMRAK